MTTSKLVQKSCFIGVFQYDSGPPKHALELRDCVKSIFLWCCILGLFPNFAKQTLDPWLMSSKENSHSFGILCIPSPVCGLLKANQFNN